MSGFAGFGGVSGGHIGGRLNGYPRYAEARSSASRNGPFSYLSGSVKDSFHVKHANSSQGSARHTGGANTQRVGERMHKSTNAYPRHGESPHTYKVNHNQQDDYNLLVDQEDNE